MADVYNMSTAILDSTPSCLILISKQTTPHRFLCFPLSFLVVWVFLSYRVSYLGFFLVFRLFCFNHSIKQSTSQSINNQLDCCHHGTGYKSSAEHIISHPTNTATEAGSLQFSHHHHRQSQLPPQTHITQATKPHRP